MAAFLGCVLSIMLLLLPAASAEAGAAEADAPMPRVTVSLAGASLSEALFFVFQDTHLRFEAPKGARETFTADLKDVPLEKALRILLEPRGYTFLREGDVYRISRKEGYESPSEKYQREADERIRREAAERSGRPRYVRPWIRARFLDAPGRVSVVAGPVGGYRSPYLLYGDPTGGRSPVRVVSIDRSPRDSRSFSLGPLSVDLPEGLRLLPGGGWEWSTPTEGEAEISDGLGTRVIPFSGDAGLTVRRR